jgi:hypothetical protein
MQLLRLFVVLIFAVVAGGCASFDPDGPKVSKFGPGPVLAQPVDSPDLISIITEGKDSYVVGTDRDGHPTDDATADAEFNRRLDGALKVFYASGNADGLKLRRNRIQDRLVLASDNACEAFKVILKRKQSNANFKFGAASVLFGAGGAISTVASTASTLAALAGASAGLRAEYNRDYFADSAAHLITRGVTKRRSEILKVMRETGHQLDTDKYSLESALADVVTYHGACSLVGGLEYADGAVSSIATGATLGLDVTKAAISKSSTTAGDPTPVPDATKKQ